MESKTIRTRFNVKQFHVLTGIVTGIITKVAQERLTHARMLELRAERLYSHEYWKHLPIDS